MTEEIRRILDAANQAPSGENCQPWRFVLSGETVEVHVRPERDQSYYSWGQRASYFACGAALENLVITAAKEGYRANVTYFPAADDMWHIATVQLKKDAAVSSDPLAASVHERISNRKPYKTGALTSEEKEALLSAAHKTGFGALTLIEDREVVNMLGRVGSTNEEVMLANRTLHDFFFSHVSWTKEEDDKKKVGFYIKTLELPPPAEKMFKLFRRWSIMRILVKLGFNRAVAKQNAVVNGSAAAIGGFVIPGTEPLDFVKAGRTIERVWLAATAQGLAFQPLTGVLFFKLKIEAGEYEVFTPTQQARITDAYALAAQAFAAGDKHLAFMFRVGHGEAPSAHAVRFSLDEAMASV